MNEFVQVFVGFFLFMAFLLLVGIGMVLFYIGVQYMDLLTDKIDKYFENKGKK